jgi:UDP-glucose 4-epimerase
VDFSPEQMQYLNYGRVVCNARLKSEFGYTPAYSTEQAFDTLLSGRPVPPLLQSSWVGAAEAGVARLLRLPGKHGPKLAEVGHG